MTARESFKKETRYSIVHLFGTEARWYPTRTRDKATNGKELKSLKYNLNAKTNGFFLSVFADLGFGVTSQYKYAFLAEYGLGLGYTLFDCIPFTFQVGLNQRNEPIFFLGVVSRIVHIP